MDETRYRLVSERLAVWNGQQVELELSETNAYGYRFVCFNKDRPHPYYIKAKVDDDVPRSLSGTFSDSPWEAAARYAYFKAYWPKEEPLPEKQTFKKFVPTMNFFNGADNGQNTTNIS